MPREDAVRAQQISASAEQSGRFSFEDEQLAPDEQYFSMRLVADGHTTQMPRTALF